MRGDIIRVREASEQGHVSKGMIYVWLNQDSPPFESWVVRRKGFERGIRYIRKSSFLQFIESQLHEEEPAKEATA
jgi:hypothetical protein